MDLHRCTWLSSVLTRSRSRALKASMASFLFLNTYSFLGASSGTRLQHNTRVSTPTHAHQHNTCMPTQHTRVNTTHACQHNTCLSTQHLRVNTTHVCQYNTCVLTQHMLVITTHACQHNTHVNSCTQSNVNYFNIQFHVFRRETSHYANNFIQHKIKSFTWLTLPLHDS